MDKTSLGSRMKEYESVPKKFLMRKTPVIIRLDGKAFHTFTKGFDKPFDKNIESAMTETMLYLCESIQGCVLGYTQSDEITLVLADWQSIDTDAWFSYNVQKMVSVSASMATFIFSLVMRVNADFSEKDKAELIHRKINNGAFFDARCFNLPMHEVPNVLIWRQQDATRNSIQGLAQSLFSHKELQGLKCNQLQDKIFTEKGINWNDLTTYQKRGACAVKDGDGNWYVDWNIPIFTEDRDYIKTRLEFYS